MLKSSLIAAIQFEIRRHNWTTYMKDGIMRPGLQHLSGDDKHHEPIL
jgi:hypothetical protein